MPIPLPPTDPECPKLESVRWINLRLRLLNSDVFAAPILFLILPLSGMPRYVRQKSGADKPMG